MALTGLKSSEEPRLQNRANLQPLPSRYVTMAVVVMLLVLIGQLAYSVSHESLSWDEGDHIFAGYLSWKGDYGMNPEHPPLAKKVATLPLLFMKLKVPALQGRFFKHESSFDGRDLIYGNDAAKVIFRVRMAAMSFTVLLALLVFAATREMFGSAAALFALAFFVFEPNILAHGALVTTDMGITCFMFASIYAFYRYIKKPTLRRLLLTGCVLGVALAVKHSGVFIFPIIAFLAAIEVFRNSTTTGNNSESRPHKARRLPLAFLIIIGISIVILWSAYGFRYSMRPSGLAISPTLSDFAKELDSPIASRAILTLSHWHALPEAYLYGLVDVKVVADNTGTYIFGNVYPHGKWFYFPALMLIKCTVSVLIFLLSLPLILFFHRTQHFREILFLAVPPVFYFIVAILSGLNIGVRHVLPIFPFLIVLVAYAAWALVHSNRRWIYPVAAVLLFHVISSVRAFPVSYIPYSNELWGGPSQTYKYLSDSNVDWGQQMIATKRYVDARGITDCWFAYFPESGIRFRDYGIPCKTLPTPDTMWFGEQTDVPPVIQGPVFISASDLAGEELGSNILNPYRNFQHLHPSAFIEDGVFVFDGKFEVPLASALGHIQRSQISLDHQQFEDALTEAQAAASVAPNDIQPQMMLGDVLTAMHRDVEARPAYERALAIVQTMEPEAKNLWTATVQKQLDRLKP
jgi:dolichyl-phosphate-mannose-protein mannosyltransferase